MKVSLAIAAASSLETLINKKIKHIVVSWRHEIDETKQE